jgi:hypothetical protein
MRTALPSLDYYGDSAPPCDPQPTAGLPATGLAGRREGRSQGGSHVHHEPVDGSAPSYSPAASPRVRRSPSPWPPSRPSDSPLESRPSVAGWACAAARPMSTRFGAGVLLSGVPPLVPALVRLSILLAEPGPSGGANPARRCRGCFPPFLAPLRSGCPQLHRPAATGRRWSPFISTRSHGASWRTRSTFQRWRSSRTDESIPRRAIRARIPRRRSQARLAALSYPLSASTLSGRWRRRPDGVRIGGMSSRAAANMAVSATLAAVTTAVSGSPPPSQTR